MHCEMVYEDQASTSGGGQEPEKTEARVSDSATNSAGPRTSSRSSRSTPLLLNAPRGLLSTLHLLCHALLHRELRRQPRDPAHDPSHYTRDAHKHIHRIEKVKSPGYCIVRRNYECLENDGGEDDEGRAEVKRGGDDMAEDGRVSEEGGGLAEAVGKVRDGKGGAQGPPVGGEEVRKRLGEIQRRGDRGRGGGCG